MKRIILPVLAFVLLLGCGGPGLAPTGPGLGDTATATDGEPEAEDEDDEDDESEDEDDGEDAEICLLQNCDDDIECSNCEDGKTMCYLRDHRCVACDPDTGKGCPDGLECTEYGNCVEPEVECPTGDDGVPRVECETDDDCGACHPDNQACDRGACVECTEENTDRCQSTEICVANRCVAHCPSKCSENANCQGCAGPRGESAACHRRRCAECTNEGSDPVPCPAGEQCNDEGVCVPVCGIPGQAPGTCDNDGDCSACEGENTRCHAPINGGHGVCGPEAAGCSDLGDGVAVLPDPYDDVTNLCSNDGDCHGVGIQYNVGELLRDLTGIDSIDDANIDYPMARCANATVGLGGHSLSCGVCVPCKVDNDCNDISVNGVVSDAFGPLGGIATAILLDQLFGNADQKIHMFCQEVAGDYGVCAPCPSLLNDCTAGGGGSTGAANSCAGRCGKQALGAESCYCDAACVEHGDCCDDYEATCGAAGSTCEGRCGGQAASGSCWCDAACSEPQNNDCCADIQQACGDNLAGTCEGHCGEQAPSGCWCDTACSDPANDDCCADMAQACGTTGSGSCIGYCGKQSLAGCWCDSACTSPENDDCCEGATGYEEICEGGGGSGGGGGSCYGHCGGSSPDGCNCDDNCVFWGNCCADYYDECSNAGCGDFSYECPDGECIPFSWVCDGEYIDCFDGSDEEGCPGGGSCSAGQWTCDDGQCISASAVCNDIYNCWDGSDEYYCPGDACDNDEWQCNDGECIPLDWVCDCEYDDCFGGEDEIGCGC